MTLFGLKWPVRIWRTRRHTPNKNSQEFPPPSGAGRNGKPCGNNESDFKCCSISPDVNFYTVNPLLSSPGAYIFQAHMKGGLNRDGGLG